MGRPSFQPTDWQRRMVRSLAACGTRQDLIAAVMELSSRTLRKHFRDELDRAAVEANAQVAQKLFKKAVDGNITAAIFWLKCRANWRERGSFEGQDSYHGRHGQSPDQGGPASPPEEDKSNGVEKRQVSRIVWRPAEPLKTNLPREGDSNPPALATSDPRSENEAEKPEVEPPEAPDSPSDGGMPEWWKRQFRSK